MFMRFSNHKLYEQLLRDGEVLKKYQPEDTWGLELLPGNDEYEYYIHRVGFAYVNLAYFCDQLDFAIEYLSMYDYRRPRKKDGPNRINYLTDNIENYLIRLQSIQDRLLQLINNVYHLCNDEEKVTYDIITSNVKVRVKSV